jgi:tRNA (mo5U34)-methyltransferase
MAGNGLVPDPTHAADASEVRRRMDEIRWYHSIDLGGGVVTPGVDRSTRRLPRLEIPEDLSGMRVLDIGAWDGFYSFECERRGAAQVTAIDSYSWDGSGWGSKSGFDLAHEVLGSSVKSLVLDVMELSPQRVGTFDVVLFLGVLYHLRHPLEALERVASVADGLLILETQVDLVGMRRPAMAFYPTRELNRDDSNWWAPNPPALHAMLRDVGFTQFRVVTPPYALPKRIARAGKWAVKGTNPFLRGIDQGRTVVHARR